MMFELHLGFEFCVNGLQTMSERSKRTASQFAGLQNGQHHEHETSNKTNQVVDEGFSKLRDELNRQLEEQAGELKSEPEIGNILTTDFTDLKETKVTRADLGGVLRVRYDARLRTVKIKCDGALAFTYYVEAILNTGGLNCYYVGGEQKKDMGTIGMEVEKVADFVADKSLRALLGMN